jgi:hypothetical protein
MLCIVGCRNTGCFIKSFGSLDLLYLYYYYSFAHKIKNIIIQLQINGNRIFLIEL